MHVVRSAYCELQASSCPLLRRATIPRRTCTATAAFSAHSSIDGQGAQTQHLTRRPLLIFGKGAAYSKADAALQSFVEATGIPFLGTAMGRGCVPDSHPNCVAAARSLALAQADVALIVGARWASAVHASHDGYSEHGCVMHGHRHGAGLRAGQPPQLRSGRQVAPTRAG